MIELTHSKSNTAIIVIHEIYGINQHMKDFCHSLFEQNFDVFCPNVLEIDVTFDYDQEEIAYQHFMENVGLENALSKIKSVLSEMKDDYERIFIVGFSIGATIAWLCSEEDAVTGVVGYYGSRIRDHLNIIPQAPTLLLFPEEEKSFDVDELISVLREKEIKTYKFSGLHGFSDSYSTQYNQESAEKAFEEMIDFFSMGSI